MGTPSPGDSKSPWAPVILGISAAVFILVEAAVWQLISEQPHWFLVATIILGALFLLVVNVAPLVTHSRGLYGAAVLLGGAYCGLLIYGFWPAPETPITPRTPETRETYAQMSNQQLRTRAFKLVADLRELVAEGRRRLDEINDKDWEDYETRDTDPHRHAATHTESMRESRKIFEDTQARYTNDFKSDAKLLRDEILSRLSPEVRQSVPEPPGAYDWGGMPELVADHLERLAKLLPSDLLEKDNQPATPPDTRSLVSAPQPMTQRRPSTVIAACVVMAALLAGIALGTVRWRSGRTTPIGEGWLTERLVEAGFARADVEQQAARCLGFLNRAGIFTQRDAQALLDDVPARREVQTMFREELGDPSRVLDVYGFCYWTPMLHRAAAHLKDIVRIHMRQAIRSHRDPVTGREKTREVQDQELAVTAAPSKSKLELVIAPRGPYIMDDFDPSSGSYRRIGVKNLTAADLEGVEVFLDSFSPQGADFLPIHLDMMHGIEQPFTLTPFQERHAEVAEYHALDGSQHITLRYRRANQIQAVNAPYTLAIRATARGSTPCIGTFVLDIDDRGSLLLTRKDD